MQIISFLGRVALGAALCAALSVQASDGLSDPRAGRLSAARSSSRAKPRRD